MKWQLIETAPQLVEVLIYVSKGKPAVFTAELDGKEWTPSVEGRYAPADAYFGDPPKRPTHWMPLPTPPLDNA